MGNNPTADKQDDENEKIHMKDETNLRQRHKINLENPGPVGKETKTFQSSRRQMFEQGLFIHMLHIAESIVLMIGVLFQSVLDEEYRTSLLQYFFTQADNVFFILFSLLLHIVCIIFTYIYYRTKHPWAPILTPYPTFRHFHPTVTVVTETIRLTEVKE